MSLRRKLEVPNDLPKITKIKLFGYFFYLQNSGQQSLTIFMFHVLTTIQLLFKNRDFHL